MREFRKKQKRLFNILKALVIFCAVFLFIFIGLKPIIADYNQTVALGLGYFADVLVLGTLIFLFCYYSKYGKCDSFLTGVENELSDAGYYFTSRQSKDIDSYIDEMYDDLKSCGYAMNKNIEINELDFNAKAVKKRELLYIASSDNIDKNDIVAYLDSVIYDITAVNLKKSGTAVVCFVTDKAEDNAIELSKMITPLDKKGRLKIAIAIAEVTTSRVYFLGNQKTKSQQLIANFVMNCDVPIKDEYIGKETLPYQIELEERMKAFNLKDFNSGNFFAH